MYQITAKHVRPSTDVPFFSPLGTDDEAVQFRAHWEQAYKSTGKLLLLDQQLSIDQLTQTTVFFWDCEESYTNAMLDPIVAAHWAVREAHNDTNGIVQTVGEGVTI